MTTTPEADPAVRPSLLTMREISKSFPGVQALSSVDITVHAGEIHAVVGENGAGKSTLMKILAGVHGPTSGRITWDGREVVIPDPHVAQQLGIRMVYQELSLVPDLTVAENIALGRMPTTGPFLDRKAMDRQARSALESIGSNLAVDRMVGDLAISQRQLVEIARVVSAGARLVVLDEPTSSLSEHEAQNLLRVVRSLKANGIAVIYISHRLHEVLDIAERVTVMRDGRTVETRAATGTSAADLIRMMVGRDLDDVFPKSIVPIGDVVFSTRALTSTVFRDISVTVRRGEIVGMAGLVGAGRTEFARAVFGLDRIVSGTVAVAGRTFAPRHPRNAIRHGIAYVPEDRRQLGIVPPLEVRDNITLAALRGLASLGFIRKRAERAAALASVHQLGVTPPRIDSRIVNLSGGNQQKVVLARWLMARPALLILDEPTRGVDVGAKAEIHRIIGELAAAGMAILLISSELPEVIAASDRMYVLHEGGIAAELTREQATEEAILAAATGAGGRDD